MDQVEFEVGTTNTTRATRATTTTTTDRNADNFLKRQSHSMATMNDNATQWTFTEELQLLQARAAGKTWNQIQIYHFPSKTTAICQAYYETVMTRAGRRNGNSTVEKPTEESSEASWAPIQAEIGEAWEVVEEMLTASTARDSTQTIEGEGQSARRRVKSLAPSHSVRSNVSTDSGVYMGPSRSSSGSVRQDDNSWLSPAAWTDRDDILDSSLLPTVALQPVEESSGDIPSALPLLNSRSFPVLPPILPPGDITTEPQQAEWETPSVAVDEPLADDAASAGRISRTLRRHGFGSRIESPSSSASEQTDSETSFRKRMRDNVAVKLTRASQKTNLRRPLTRKSGFRRSITATATTSSPQPESTSTMESPISRRPTPTLRCSAGRSIKTEARRESRFDDSSDDEDPLQAYMSRFADSSDDEGAAFADELIELPSTSLSSEDEHSTTATVRAAADCPRPDSPILPAQGQPWSSVETESPRVGQDSPECDRRASTFSMDSACETSSDTSMPSMHGGMLQTHLVDGLLPWFERWLAAQFRTHGGGSGSQRGGAGGRSRNGSQGGFGSGGPGEGPSGSKRQPDDDTDGTGESNGDGFGNDPKKPRMSAAPEDEQRFACPYFKHNPIKYRDWRSCPGPGFKTVHRLKEHLYRRHLLPKFTCRRCYEGFESDDELVAHQRSDTPCRVKVSHEREGIDDAQERRLRARSATAKTEYQRWIDVYRILFPNDDPSTIPHPYYDLPAGDAAATQGADCSHDDVFMNLEKYVRREAPQFLQKELEGLESELQTLINARLKAKLEDVLPRIHLQLIDGYRKSECDAVLPVVKEQQEEEEEEEATQGETLEDDEQEQERERFHHGLKQEQPQQVNTEFQRSVKYLEDMAMADFACDWDVRIAPCPVGAAGAPSMVSGSEFKDSSFSSPELDGLQSATDPAYECWASVPFPGSSDRVIEDGCLGRPPFIDSQSQHQHQHQNQYPISHQNHSPHHVASFGVLPQEDLSSGKQEAMSVEAWSRLCAGGGDGTNAPAPGDYEPYYWP